MLVLYTGQSAAKNFTPNDTPEFIEFIQKSFDKNNIKGWVSGIVTNKAMWKENFSEVPHFVDEVSADVEAILNKGMMDTLKSIMA
jgi:tagaturonate reductase